MKVYQNRLIPTFVSEIEASLYSKTIPKQDLVMLSKIHWENNRSHTMANKKNNLFEMGSDFSDAWTSDNKEKAAKQQSTHCKEMLAPQKHQLHFAKEKRRGKVVTIVKPFCLEKKELQALLKQIKKKLGTGGTLKENALEFQGELRTQLRTALEALEYRFKT